MYGNFPELVIFNTHCETLSKHEMFSSSAPNVIFWNQETIKRKYSRLYYEVSLSLNDIFSAIFH